MISKGSKGEEVRAWQLFLVGRGYTLDTDGDFGERTEYVTRAFQKSNGLDGDGKVGPETLAIASKAGYDPGTPTIAQKPVASTSEDHRALYQGTASSQHNEAMMSHMAPAFVARLRKFIDAAARDGVELRIVQGLRTWAEQDQLYAQGRSRPGKKVTNARGGQSNHNFGVAADLSPVVGGNVSWDEKLYQPYGKWAVEAGLSWGGNWRSFKDLPHVELIKGHSTADFRAAFAKGGLAACFELIAD